MVGDHPLLGVGPDNFLHYYAPRRAPGAPWYNNCQPGEGYIEPGAIDEPCLSHPHNEILDFWLSTGILGLLSFIWLEVIFWRVSLRGWARWRVRREAPLALGAMAAMLAALVHGLVDNSYFLIDLSLIFWYLVALASFLARRDPDPGERGDSPWVENRAAVLS
jgi:O-antigen ligase